MFVLSLLVNIVKMFLCNVYHYQNVFLFKKHGKDFDAIQNWIATKCRRKNVNPGLIKNKDQVRHLYYRTWHKISKFIDVDTGKHLHQGTSVHQNIFL